MGKRIKAQIAIEFILLVCVAFVILIVFLTSLRSQAIDLNERKDFVLVKDLAYKVQHEINMAVQVKPGYTRTFFIPEKLDSNDYTMIQTKGKFTVVLKKSEFTVSIPEIKGDIKKGDNTIKNLGGVVYLN